MPFKIDKKLKSYFIQVWVPIECGVYSRAVSNTVCMVPYEYWVLTFFDMTDSSRPWPLVNCGLSFCGKILKALEAYFLKTYFGLEKNGTYQFVINQQYCTLF